MFMKTARHIVILSLAGLLTACGGSLSTGVEWDKIDYASLTCDGAACGHSEDVAALGRSKR